MKIICIIKEAKKAEQKKKRKIYYEKMKAKKGEDEEKAYRIRLNEYKNYHIILEYNDVCCFYSKSYQLS